LSLELCEKYTSKGQLNVWADKNNGSDLTSILEKYKSEAVFGDKIQILTDEKLEELINSVKAFKLDKEFLQELDKDAKQFKEKSKK